MPRKGYRKKDSGALSSAAIKENERLAQAMELRLQGWSLADIATQLGLMTEKGRPSVARIRTLIEEGMADRVMPSLDELRDQTLWRLDALLTGFMPSALQGDHASLQSVLSIVAVQRRITGMDAAIQIKGELGGEITHSGKVDVGGTFVVEFVSAPAAPMLEGKVNGANGHATVDVISQKQ